MDGSCGGDYKTIPSSRLTFGSPFIIVAEFPPPSRVTGRRRVDGMAVVIRALA
jgi:hypothetical protein